MTLEEYLGLPDTNFEERPATAEDILSAQAQLANTNNDPNMTLITHWAEDIFVSRKFKKPFPFSECLRIIKK